jgi:periplasmic divalent cation tolerance protein
VSAAPQPDTGGSLRVVVASASESQAPELVRAVVEEGLAACGNVMPGVRAIYRWQGEVHDEPEALIWLETRAELAAALVDRLAQLHAYELPKLLVLDVADAWPAYAAWVAAQTPGRAPSR